MNEAPSKDQNRSIKRGPAWQAAEAAGLDMSLVELKLTKSVSQRVQEHDDALALAQKLRKAGEQLRAKA